MMIPTAAKIADILYASGRSTVTDLPKRIWRDVIRAARSGGQDVRDPFLKIDDLDQRFLKSMPLIASALSVAHIPLPAAHISQSIAHIPMAASHMTLSVAYMLLSTPHTTLSAAYISLSVALMHNSATFTTLSSFV